MVFDPFFRLQVEQSSLKILIGIRSTLGSGETWSISNRSMSRILPLPSGPQAPQHLPSCLLYRTNLILLDLLGHRHRFAWGAFSGGKCRELACPSRARTGGLLLQPLYNQVPLLSLQCLSPPIAFSVSRLRCRWWHNHRKGSSTMSPSLEDASMILSIKARVSGSGSPGVPLLLDEES